MELRAEHLREMRELLARIERTREVALALGPSVPALAQLLLEARHSDDDMDVCHALGWLHWFRYLALPQGSDEQELDLALTLFEVCFLDGVENIPEQVLPHVIERAASAAFASSRQAVTSSDPELAARAIDLWERVIDAAGEDDPDRPNRLSMLGVVRRCRFERTGTLDDLDQAIRVGTMAVESTVEDDPDRALWLHALSGALLVRFEHAGTPADLDGAIRNGALAVRGTADDHPDYAERLSHLSVALMKGFRRNGVLADLDEAVQTGTLALAAAPVGHLHYARLQSNLGNVLRMRFIRTGAMEDLDEAVRVGMLAVQNTEEGHPELAVRLSNLGGALHTRFARTGELTDLTDAVRIGKRAVEAFGTDHPGHGRSLANLAGSLQTLYLRTRAPEVLDEAVQVGWRAVEAAREGHPDRAGQLSNLAAALHSRFDHSGDPGDLDEAIRVGTLAAQTAIADHPDHAAILVNLGNAHRALFERTGDPETLERAVELYTEAVRLSSAAPSHRIRAGRAAGDLIGSTDPARAADLLEQAVRLLPEAASDRLLRADRQHALGGAAGLASDAAALALLGPGPERPRAERALRLLEAGRAVLLGEALGTRSDATELATAHPELASRLADLRAVLNREPDHEPTEPRHGSARARSSVDLAVTLEQIRELPGFETFGLPPSIDRLRAHAAAGPVVSFAVSGHTSAALVLRTDGVTAVPLPGLTPDVLIERIGTFYGALEATHGPLSGRADANQALLDTLAWLWDKAAEPVLVHLGHQRAPADGEPWPRVWWATGGMLGLLPLHAAGHHTDPAEDPHRRTVADRAVSSHTPTVRALVYARRPRPAATTAETSLIVAMPTTPDLPEFLHGAPLHHVSEEARHLAGILPAPLLLSGHDPVAHAHAVGATAILAAEPPTWDRVLAALPACKIAHFACHGVADADDPSRSRLLLDDHRDNPLTVASLSSVDLRTPRLAYLSACNTSANLSEALLDEAIHLAGAFQLAGFTQVIGTLWPIDDEFAVEVAIGVYSALRDQDGELNPENAATALHHTIRALINEQELHTTPWLWAPYIHAGA